MANRNKMELSNAAFNGLYALLDKRGKNVTVDKETFGKLLRDHSTLHGLVKPEFIEE